MRHQLSNAKIHIVVELLYLGVFLVWAVVVVVLVLVVRCWWWSSGDGGGGDSICKGGSCNSFRSAIVKDNHKYHHQSFK